MTTPRNRTRRDFLTRMAGFGRLPDEAMKRRMREFVRDF